MYLYCQSSKMTEVCEPKYDMPQGGTRVIQKPGNYYVDECGNMIDNEGYFIGNIYDVIENVDQVNTLCSVTCNVEPNFSSYDPYCRSVDTDYSNFDNSADTDCSSVFVEPDYVDKDSDDEHDYILEPPCEFADTPQMMLQPEKKLDEEESQIESEALAGLWDAASGLAPDCSYFTSSDIQVTLTDACGPAPDSMAEGGQDSKEVAIAIRTSEVKQDTGSVTGCISSQHGSSVQYAQDIRNSSSWDVHEEQDKTPMPNSFDTSGQAPDCGGVADLKSHLEVADCQPDRVVEQDTQEMELANFASGSMQIQSTDGITEQETGSAYTSGRAPECEDSTECVDCLSIGDVTQDFQCASKDQMMPGLRNEFQFRYLQQEQDSFLDDQSADSSATDVGSEDADMNTEPGISLRETESSRVDVSVQKDMVHKTMYRIPRPPETSAECPLEISKETEIQSGECHIDSQPDKTPKQSPRPPEGLSSIQETEEQEGTKVSEMVPSKSPRPPEITTAVEASEYVLPVDTMHKRPDRSPRPPEKADRFTELSLSNDTEKEPGMGPRPPEMMPPWMETMMMWQRPASQHSGSPPESPDYGPVGPLKSPQTIATRGPQFKRSGVPEKPP